MCTTLRRIPWFPPSELQVPVWFSRNIVISPRRLGLKKLILNDSLGSQWGAYNPPRSHPLKNPLTAQLAGSGSLGGGVFTPPDDGLGPTGWAGFPRRSLGPPRAFRESPADPDPEAPDDIPREAEAGVPRVSEGSGLGAVRLPRTAVRHKCDHERESQ